jgi:2'-5' RNA ligase
MMASDAQAVEGERAVRSDLLVDADRLEANLGNPNLRSRLQPREPRSSRFPYGEAIPGRDTGIPSGGHQRWPAWCPVSHLTRPLLLRHRAHLDVRMFVAVWPDGSTLKRLSLLELGSTEGLRLVRPGQWHITLRFLGDVDDGLVPALVRALAAAAGKLPDSIHCEMGPNTAWFGGDRVLQIPVSGLDEAADAIRSATLSVLPDTDHGGPLFTGHVTVARANRHRLDASARVALAGIPFAASFEVDCFDLMVSELSTDGPRYATLARVPLRG